jgi:transmembrane sensor
MMRDSLPPGQHEQAALQAAIEWYVRLSSGEAGFADQDAWQAWCQASAVHQAAWNKLETVTGKFQQVPVAIGMPLLKAGPQAERRRVLKQLGLVLLLGGAGIQGYRHLPWQEWNADIKTAVGEQRNMTLADGSTLMINTDTALDIRFTATHRLIHLYHGEILVETGREPGPYRPFKVVCAHGELTALGTRFGVRDTPQGTRLSVHAHAVRVQPNAAQAHPYTVPAGMASLFNASGQISLSPLPPLADSWALGVLYADNMPLPQFIHELGRYRHGWIRLAPALEHLRISGSFPLADTDAILHSLARTLPLQLSMLTPYLVMLQPLPA